MKIEPWEFLQFFDEHIELPDMSYGLLAYRLKTPAFEIEFHLDKVACSAELVINSGVKQLIKVNDIKEIEINFSELLVTQGNGGLIKVAKNESLSFLIEI